jgi:hypothetical protein
MKYAVEIGSCAMIYLASFIKIGSGIQKLRFTDTQTAWLSISLLLFFRNN